MKKLFIIIFLFLLTACGKVRQDDLYTLNINGIDVTVGYDDSSKINDYIDSYTSLIDDKGNEYLDKIVVYPNDYNLAISVDGIALTSSISESCTLLNGEYSDSKNGEVCLLAKRVKKHDNYVLLYGDILSDNLDKLDRVEVYYK